MDLVDATQGLPVWCSEMFMDEQNTMRYVNLEILQVYPAKWFEEKLA